MTSTESSGDHTHNNNNNNSNNNNNTTKYTAFEDLRSKHQSHHSQQQQTQSHQHQLPHQSMERDSPPGHGHGPHGLLPPGLTQLDTKVGNSSDIKPDEDENKCFICKVNFSVLLGKFL